MQMIARSYLAYDLTSSPLLLGLVSSGFAVPVARALALRRRVRGQAGAQVHHPVRAGYVRNPRRSHRHSHRPEHHRMVSLVDCVYRSRRAVLLPDAGASGNHPAAGGTGTAVERDGAERRRDERDDACRSRARGMGLRISGSIQRLLHHRGTGDNRLRPDRPNPQDRHRSGTPRRAHDWRHHRWACLYPPQPAGAHTAADGTGDRAAGDALPLPDADIHRGCVQDGTGGDGTAGYDYGRRLAGGLAVHRVPGQERARHAADNRQLHLRHYAAAGRRHTRLYDCRRSDASVGTWRRGASHAEPVADNGGGGGQVQRPRDERVHAELRTDAARRPAPRAPQPSTSADRR